MGKKRNRSESFTKLSTTDSGKRSDDCDSQEEFDTEAGLAKLSNAYNGVRCSARVIEKQEKLRRESSPAKQGSAMYVDHSGLNQPSSATTPTTRTSLLSPSNHALPGDAPPITESYWERDLCSLGTADTDTISHNHPSHESAGAGNETSHSYSSHIPITNKRAHEEKRKKRNWEVWSQDDKLHFFEALNEFGKDFDAIQNHLASKQKSRSRMALSSTSFVPKNKDQVRHFYYRTWHKIAKHLKFPKDMKRANQELYGLVNYGELRKKQRVLNVKNAAKLSELMEKGMTTIKVRGKTFRIKTPVCRAIKRMNLLDDEHSRVPCKIWLELTAKDLKAWSTVQSVAHNPRICAQVPPQRTLSSIITYFEEKWKTPTERLKEQFVHGFGKKRVPLLRFIPVEQDTRTPIFKMSECTNSAMISLKSYTEKVLQKPAKDSELERLHSRNKARRKQSGSGNLSDSHGEPELSDADVADGTKYITKIRTSSDLEEKTEEKCCDQLAEVTDYPNNLISISQSEEKVEIDSKSFDEPVTPAPGNMSNMCSCSPSTKYHVRDRDSEDIVGHIWDDETIKRGWNAPEAGLITIGELYLMLGRCQRLAFNYCWDDDEQEREPKLIDKLVEVARALRKRKSMRTKSHNSYNATPTTNCPKCGYQCDQFTPPQPPVIPQRAQEHEHLPHNFPVPATTPNVYPTQAVLPSAISSYITVYASSMSTFTNSHNTQSTATAVPNSIEPPPKPFMDLTKGNRRISRISSRRIFLPNFPRPSLQQHINPGSSTANLQPQHHFENIGGDRNVCSRGFLNTLGERKEPTHPDTVSNQVNESCQLPISSSEIASLLKDKSNDKNVDPENTFSLSSFMDISLPESTRLVADDVSLNVDRLLDESSIGEKSRILETPRKSPTNQADSNEMVQCEQLQNTSDGPWMPEANELTFTNLLTTFDMGNSRRGESSQPEVQDVNFQSVVGEVNFTSNFPPTV